MVMMAKLIQLNIGGRVYLGFGIVLAIQLAQGILGTTALQSAASRFQTYATVDKTISEVHEIENNVMDLQRSVLIFTFSGYDGIVSRIRRLQDTLKQQFIIIGPHIEDKARTDVLSRMEGHFRNYVDNFNAALEERHLRDELSNGQMSVLAKEISESLSTLLNELVGQNNYRIAATVGVVLDKFFQAHQKAMEFQRTPDSMLVHECEGAAINVKRILGDMKGDADSDKLKETISIIADKSARYFISFQGMVRASRAYLYLVYVVMPGEAVEFSRLASDLRNASLNIKNGLSSDINKASQDSSSTALYFSVLAVFVSGLLSWLISRSISRPVVAMTHALTELASGRRETNIPGRGRGDEIGAMAKAADIFKVKVEELDQANQYKSKFLAMMSHEIRTPITSVLGVADLLRRTNLTEEQSGYLNILKSSTKSLLTILNDILDISKLEAGKITIECEPFNPRATAQEVIGLAHGSPSAKGLTLDLTISDDVPPAVTGDQTRVKQILYNLLSNAIKFTENGSVTVQMSTNWMAEGAVEILTKVVDTGIGIESSQRDKLFLEFSQADQSTTRRFGGTGLGLAITKILVELMGGQVGFESEHDHGATFWFTIPYRVIETSTSEVPEHGIQPVCVQATIPIRILLAEDNRINQMLVRSMLQKLGHTVQVVGNGREALDAVIAENFDVVLMDMQMPEMDGEEATKAIRCLPSPKNRLPILALTADVMTENRARYLQAGVNDLVPKPIDWQLLTKTLNNVVNVNSGHFDHHDQGILPLSGQNKHKPHGLVKGEAVGAS
ncbi:MAG: ATP-binding protein [Rhodospirillaceae bacterium]